MGQITADKTRLPLIVYDFLGNQTDDDIQFFIDCVEELHQNKIPYGSVGNIIKYTPNMAQVKQVGYAMLKNQADMKELCAASAIVIPNAAFRFVLSSFFLIAPIPYPYLVTDSVDEAIAFVCEKLEEAGHKVPAPKG